MCHLIILVRFQENFQYFFNNPLLILLQKSNLHFAYTNSIIRLHFQDSFHRIIIFTFSQNKQNLNSFQFQINPSLILIQKLSIACLYYCQCIISMQKFAMSPCSSHEMFQYSICINKFDVMNYLNLPQISLLSSSIHSDTLTQMMREVQNRQGVKLGLQFEEWSLLENAEKLNQRESWKIIIFKEKKKTPKVERWMFGELKVFVAVVLLRCLVTNKRLTTLDQQDKIYFNSIFCFKSLEFIKYELAVLIHSREKIRRQWKVEQENLMKSIIAKIDGAFEWRTISVNLFSESKGVFFRTQKQCRQKWKNYLDPKLNKGSWSEQQDEKLMKLIGMHGLKWSYIASKFHGKRTEHMVKNRYNSFIKSWKVKKSRKFKVDSCGQGESNTEKECAKDILEDKIGNDENKAISNVSKYGNDKMQIENQVEKPEISEINEPIVECLQYQTIIVDERGEDMHSYEYFQKKVIQNQKNYDKFLKRTNDQQDLLSTSPHAHLKETVKYWHIGQNQNNGFQSLFSMQPQVQKTAITEIVAALGCSHYQSMLGSWQHQDDANIHFDWMQ